MEVIRAKSAGFCFGVKRAVDTVYEQVEKQMGKQIYTYGPIIHNEEVVKDMEAHGVKVLRGEEELKGLEEGLVIIRSHGVPKRICDLMDEKGIEYVDATCPFVKRIHKIVAEESKKGSRIIIIGNPDHPEVEGIRGWAGENVTVIKNAEEAEKFENAMKKVYFQNAKYFNIPGFRKGKAPMNIVEKYYGAQIFYEDAFNEVATEAYEEALTENKIDVVSRPEVDIAQMEKGKDLIFTAVVQTKPEVKLGKYKGIEIQKIEYKVDKKDVDHELEHMQEHNSRLVTVDDRPLENGDTATIDFEGFVDGVAFEGGKAEGHELEIGSGTFIPGFEEQLIGMELENEKEIKVTFPKEYFSKDLAGKDATFKVKLHDIKKKELPELDDEFAKDVSEFDTLEELKKSIKEKLTKNKEQREKYETEEAVLKAVCEDSKLDIPSGMIELEIDNMLKDFEQRLSYQGLNLEQYLKMIGKTEEEMRKEYEPQAIEAIKSRLVLEAIMKAEKIEASEEEIKAKMEEMAKSYGKDVEELSKNENLKNYLAEGIKSEKALEFIVSNAKFTAKKAEKKAEKKETKATSKGEKAEKAEKTEKKSTTKSSKK